MDQSVTVARHYARLLWLLLHEPANVDEQKATLRALVTMSKDGAVSMTASGDALAANGAGVPAALSGAREVARQMGSHGVGEVAFDTGASAAGILGSARLLPKFANPIGSICCSCESRTAHGSQASSHRTGSARLLL